MLVLFEILGGRYKKLVDALVKDQYIVFGFDLQGHGRSDGKGASVDEFSIWVQNGLQFIDQITSGTLGKQQVEESDNVSSNYSSSSTEDTASYKVHYVTKRDPSYYSEFTNTSKLSDIMRTICGSGKNSNASDSSSFSDQVHSVSSSFGILTSVGAVVVENEASSNQATSNDNLLRKLGSFSLEKKVRTNKPLFLFGQGIGGLIASIVSIQKKSVVNGMVLSAPMVSVPGDLHTLLQK